MKHFYLGLSILLVLLACCLTSSLMLRNNATQIAKPLQQAKEDIINGDFSAANVHAAQATKLWHKYDSRFASVLCHDETDEITRGFAHLNGYLEANTEEEMLACCNALLAMVKHVANMEWPHYYNIL